MVKPEMDDSPGPATDDSLMVSREKPTLRQQATDILRQAIIERRFPSGKHLVERELCALLGVSRTSVREALRHLESEGLIQMVPHKGPVVASLSYQDACHIYEVRAALEGLAGELFAKNASDTLVSRLCTIGSSMAAASYSPDPDVVLKIKLQFYDVLFEGSQNPVCSQMIHSLNTRVWMLRRMSLASPGRSADMIVEVRRITDAALARDPEAMRAACMAHVESASRVVLPQLRHAENKTAP